jgi:hypothetical protein
VAEGREDLSQDPFVERGRPDPARPPEPVRILEGLLGDSDRAGRHRLYFSRELDSYAEFRDEDVVYRESIPADRPPFLGDDATGIALRRDATVEFTRVQAPRPVDEFDLDVRLGGRAGRPRGWERPTDFTVCWPFACRDDLTEDTWMPTCRFTCRPTCPPTCEPTCAATCPETCLPTCRETCAPTCPQTCVPCQTRDYPCDTVGARTRCGLECDLTVNRNVMTCAGGWPCR